MIRSNTITTSLLPDGYETNPLCETSKPIAGATVHEGGEEETVVITDEKGRERERYALTYGSQLLVHEGTEVQPGADLVTWDPFTSAILTEIAGMYERETAYSIKGLSARVEPSPRLMRAAPGSRS